MTRLLLLLALLIAFGSVLMSGCGSSPYGSPPTPSSMVVAPVAPSTEVPAPEDDGLPTIAATGYIEEVSFDPLTITFVEKTEGIERATARSDCQIAYLDGRPALPQDLKPGTLVTASGTCHRGTIEAKTIIIR